MSFILSHLFTCPLNPSRTHSPSALYPTSLDNSPTFCDAEVLGNPVCVIPWPPSITLWLFRTYGNNWFTSVINDQPRHLIIAFELSEFNQFDFVVFGAFSGVLLNLMLQG